ncbi:MAG: DUF3772 domain-containing protein, partial [Paracoccus sp. (in: a-proteobacteria)]|nr:DUF3772 domain-containing protein [Paracoccus sp. (in: a-proteobacteria)]
MIRHIAAWALVTLLAAALGGGELAAQTQAQTPAQTQAPAQGQTQPQAPASPMQGPPAPINYDVWEGLAARVEAELEDPAITDQRLDQIRAQAVSWRARFSEAQGTNTNRIRSVREQLDALGPAPGEGETEASDVAERREQLNQSLSELQAPGIAASEAFTRADAIVRLVDEINRERIADALVRVRPSPLLPSSWAAAGRETLSYLSGAGAELADRYARGVPSSARVPQAVGLLLAALFLLTRGMHYLKQMPRALSMRAGERSAAVVAFIVSLGQIFVPVIGMVLLVSGLQALGIFGRWTSPLLAALPLAAFV